MVSKSIATFVLFVLSATSTFASYNVLSRWTIRLEREDTTVKRFKRDEVFGIALDGKYFYIPTPGKTLDQRFLSTGEVSWSTPLESVSQSTWAYNNGEVFGGDSGGLFYCLDAKTGAIKWKVQTKGVFYSRPLVSEKQIWVMTSLGSLQSYGRDTGAWMWQQEDTRVTNLSLWSFQGQLFFQGYIIAGFPSSSLKAFNPETGTPIWTESFSTILTASDTFNDLKSIAASEDFLVAASFGGDLKAWKTVDKSKKPLWQKRISLHTPPAIINGKSVIFSGKDGSVQSLDLNSGFVKWQFQLPKGLGTQPIVDGDKIWVATSGGHIVVLSTDGKLLAQSHDYQASFWNPPVILPNHEALFVTSKGIVRRIHLVKTSLLKKINRPTEGHLFFNWRSSMNF